MACQKKVVLRQEVPLRFKLFMLIADLPPGSGTSSTLLVSKQNLEACYMLLASVPIHGVFSLR